MLKKITNYYNRFNYNKKRYYKLVDWPSKDRQLNEFKILTSIINYKFSYEINDYGCGVGDLIKFLKKKPNLYYGYDINKSFINICKKRFKQKNFYFFNSKNISKYSDYTISSGAFSIKGNMSEEDFEKLFLDNLSKMLKFTRTAIAINLHWNICPIKKRRDHIYYADVMKVKRYLKSKKIKNYKLKFDKKKYVFYLFIFFNFHN